MFLLHEKWITQTDIDAHNKDPYLRAAVSLQSFLGMQPGKKGVEFYHEIQGAYVHFRIIPDRFVRIVLYVSPQHDPPFLRATEEISYYRAAAADFILKKAEGLSSASYHRVGQLLQTHAEQVGRTLYSFGFGIADPKMISFLLRNELTGDTTAYLVHTLAPHAIDDYPDLMVSTRYTGWAMSEGRAEPPCEMRRVLAIHGHLSIPTTASIT